MKKSLIEKSKNHSDNQEIIRATQFYIMGGLEGDSWIWAYPQHCDSQVSMVFADGLVCVWRHQDTLTIMMT